MLKLINNNKKVNYKLFKIFKNKNQSKNNNKLNKMKIVKFFD